MYSMEIRSAVCCVAPAGFDLKTEIVMALFKTLAASVAVAGLGVALWVGVESRRSEAEIAGNQQAVAALAAKAAVPVFQNAALPEPVQRYFEYVFPEGVPQDRLVRLSAKGQFRRPGTDTFGPTTAEQVIATTTPALMFSATTPIFGFGWARAYDYFAEGKMVMKARILSALTVVDERETPLLNRISLRRWLLESALYPAALLPGGSVTWQAIDATHARAIVRADGEEASMVAEFDPSGAMVAMMAEEDGDLTLPYHGSGEHVARGDYRMVQGQRIPHRFTISRAAGGKLYPFWDGEITDISFE